MTLTTTAPGTVGPRLFRVQITYGENALNRDLRGRREYLMRGRRSRFAPRTAARLALELHQRLCREANHEDVRTIEMVAA